jgi:mannose-6-phosphate isomerase-like protein (cupin superfamily)
MRLLLPLAAFLAVAALLIGQQGHSSAVTYVPHDKVAMALAKGGPIFGASDFTVSGSHRDGPGHVEVHDHETDIMYIVDGEATLVTGGTMIGGKVTKAGQWAGTEIQGGETRHLSKGDVVVVPAGIPHWFKEVPGPINYYVVKVIK